MPHRLKIAGEVRRALAKWVEAGSSRRPKLTDILELLRLHPEDGEMLRDDTPGCYFVELDECRLYYYLDTETQMVEVFFFHQYWHNWDVG